MDRWKKRAAGMLVSLVLGDRVKPPLAYTPQKTAVSEGEQKFFRRSIPERHGISSRRLYDMLCRLESEPRANMHSLLVLAGGEVVCECSADGYRTDCWQVSHSMSKTAVGMVIAALVDEGVLSCDDLLCEIFPELGYRDRRFSQITIHHLLSMTSGVEFGEAGAITEEKWTECYFSSSMRFAPGAKFFYNSMNSYILVRAAERKSGESFETLAERLLFRPLRIESYFWERSPEGSVKGGWGLYMSPESWAKLGYTLLCGGEFFGQRIICEETARLFSEYKVTTPPSTGGFNYAYHIWCARRGRDLLFSGMLGQNVWISPENGLVVVMTGGNDELFQASPALEIVISCLGGRSDDRLSVTDHRFLRRREAEFFASRQRIRLERPTLFRRIGAKYGRGGENWRGCLGSYRFAPDAPSVLPLVIRAMQNSLGSGIELLSIRADGSAGLRILFIEGGEEHILYAGFFEREKNLLEYRGEKYLVSAVAGTTPKGGLLIELIFSETSSVRWIELHRDGDRVRLSMREQPGERLVRHLFADVYSGNPILSIVGDIVERRLGEGAIEEMTGRVFNPTAIGADELSSDADMILWESMGEADAPSIRLARRIAARLIGESDHLKTKNKKSPQQTSGEEKQDNM